MPRTSRFLIGQASLELTSQVFTPSALSEALLVGPVNVHGFILSKDDGVDFPFFYNDTTPVYYLAGLTNSQKTGRQFIHPFRVRFNGTLGFVRTTSGEVEVSIVYSRP